MEAGATVELELAELSCAEAASVRSSPSRRCPPRWRFRVALEPFGQFGQCGQARASGVKRSYIISYLLGERPIDVMANH